jgi:hypothetical protein
MVPQIDSASRPGDGPGDVAHKGTVQGTLLTIFTNIFAASLNHDIFVLYHDRRDWMHPERFIIKRRGRC